MNSYEKSTKTHAKSMNFKENSKTQSLKIDEKSKNFYTKPLVFVGDRELNVQNIVGF